jgi:hypothetical protein
VRYLPGNRLARYDRLAEPSDPPEGFSHILIK